MGWFLATVFLPDPQLALGFLLVMVVPCSSMAIGYTGLAKGDLELATVVVALSFVLAIVAVPLWMTVFAGGYGIAVPIGDLISSILTVLVAPMILGYATRQGLLRWLGSDRFAALAPLFPAALAARDVLDRVPHLLRQGQPDPGPVADGRDPARPERDLHGPHAARGHRLDRRLGMGYGEHMAIAFTSTGKNNGTAIAIATTAFSPMVACPRPRCRSSRSC